MATPKTSGPAPKLNKEEALKKLASTEKRLERAKEAEAKSKEKASESAARIKELEKELVDTRAGAKQDLDDQAAKLEEKYRGQVQELQGTIATHEEEISRLKDEKEAADKKANDAVKQVTGFENRIMKLKWDLNAAQEKEKSRGGDDGDKKVIADLKAAVERQEQEIKALKEAAAAAPAPQLEELAKAPDSNAEEIRELKQDLEPIGESGRSKSGSPPESEPPPLISPSSESETA